MKKSCKRILAVLIAFAFVLSSCATLSYAVTGLTATVGTESGMPGESVKVDVLLSGNTGLTSLNLSVAYSELLTLTAVEFNSEFGSMVTAAQPYSNPQILSFISPFAAVNANGVFATLTFCISDKAADGDVADISLTYNPEDVIDGNDETIPLNVENGKINIFEGLPGDINNDGKVTNADAIALFRYVAGWKIEVDAGALDCNGDGSVNNSDAIALFRYLAHWSDVKITRGKVCIHNLTKTESNAATCTEDGNIAYWYCSLCEKYFGDENATQKIAIENTIVEAKGHNVVIDPAVAANYEHTGLTEGSHCSVCKEVLVKQEVTPKLVRESHSITYNIANGDMYLAAQNIENANKDFYYVDEGLTLKNISCPGYNFLGWYDLPSGSNAEIVKNIAAGEKTDIELFAHWEKIPYTITFDNSSMNLPSTEKSYTVDQRVTLDKPVVDRYVFLGWTTDSDNLISEIKPGTIGNITLHSNWTSKRNLAKPISKLGDPIIVENTNEGKLLFTYEIGQIENVPLYTIKNLPSAGGVVSVYTETVKKAISTTDASTVAKAIDHITTDSTAWTLNEDWNETTHIEDSVLNEHGYDRTTGQEFGKTSSNTFTLTTNEYDNTVVKANEGAIATTTQYNTTDVNKRETWESKASLSVSDTESAKYTDSAKVSAEVGVGYGPVSAKVGASMETSTEISSSTTAGAAAETTIAHENTSHSKTGTDTVTVEDNTKTTTTDKGWSKSSNSSSSSSSSLTEYEEQTLSEKIAEEYKYGQSYAKGGSNSNSAAWSTSSGESEQYSSTLTYFNSQEETEGVSYTIDGETDGSYRLVRAGIVHVFAIVIYDIANAQYSVATYSVLDDETYTYIDYSATSAAKFDDNENGVLPFEVPYFVNDYVNGKILATDGLKYDETTLSTAEYEGSETSVVIPEYISVDNDDNTYSAYTIRHLSASTFSGKNSIKSVLLSNYIREIPDSAFTGCTSLQFVYGSEIQSIGANAFNGCVSLGQFRVASTIKSIGVNAFKDVASIVVEASNKDVVFGAINSGAKRITINISEVADKMNDVTLEIPDTVDYFELQGGRNVFKGLKIKSKAKTTVLNGITITESTGIPLDISSEAITLNQVIAESPNYVLLLKGAAPTVSLYGTSRLISASGNAVVCRNTTFNKINSNITSKLEITGNLLSCGTLENAATLINFPESGKIISITSDEFSKYIQGCFYVNFNANGGAVEKNSITAYVGTKIGSLPAPKRDYYTFDGWYTESSGGQRVTSDSVFNSANDITLYAHWTQNAISGWVLVSSVPANAQIVNTKWKYDLRTEKQSSSNTLSGYTLYDTTWVWSDYGAWSAWSTTAYSKSDSRDVQTKQENVLKDYTGYYWMKATSDNRYYYNYSISNPTYSYEGKFSIATINAAERVAPNVFKSGLTYNGTNKSNNGEYAYVLNNGSGTCLMFIKPNYVLTTYYSYRDRSKVYTYHFYKVESKEATSDPTGQTGVSNVVKYVQYRAK